MKIITADIVEGNENLKNQKWKFPDNLPTSATQHIKADFHGATFSAKMLLYTKETYGCATFCDVRCLYHGKCSSMKIRLFLY